MGQRLGASFPNALPLDRARQSGRQGDIYKTLLRAPTFAPEALGRFNVELDRFSSGGIRRFPPPIETPPIVIPATAPQPAGGFTQPGGGIRVTTNGGTTITFNQEETLTDKIKRWLDEDSIFAGVKNQWLAIAVGGYLLLRKN